MAMTRVAPPRRHSICCIAAASLVFGLACASPAADSVDAAGQTSDARPGSDAAVPSASDAAPDAEPFDPGPAPTTALQPTPGELSIIQLPLPAGVTFRLGEAAIIVGPDGTVVLLDVGNSNHDEEIRDALRELNTSYLTPARGYPAPRTALQVEWIVLTHVHGDHVGGMRDLFTGPDPLDLVHGVVHRGLVDLGEGMNTNDFGELCTLLRGPLRPHDVPLCHAASEPPCEFAQVSQPHPATNCDGLLRGDLSTASDDVDRAPSYIALGDGARLTLIGADGHMSDGTEVTPSAPFGHDSGDEENARSLVGLVEYGPFRYHFGGDLHGRPSDGPDIESHLVAVSGPTFYQSLGVDVIHAHHHARRTSSNPTFVGATAPMDGLSRNVVAGINGAHLGSPFPEVLSAWGDGGRLGDGQIWVTEVTVGGATSSELVVANGRVITQTIGGGEGYWMQAVVETVITRGYASVRRGQ